MAVTGSDISNSHTLVLELPHDHMKMNAETWGFEYLWWQWITHFTEKPDFQDFLRNTVQSWNIVHTVAATEFWVSKMPLLWRPPFGNLFYFWFVATVVRVLDIYKLISLQSWVFVRLQHIASSLKKDKKTTPGWPRYRENRDFGSYFFQTWKTQGILFWHREKFANTGKIFGLLLLI